MLITLCKINSLQPQKLEKNAAAKPAMTSFAEKPMAEAEPVFPVGDNAGDTTLLPAPIDGALAIGAPVGAPAGATTTPAA